MPNPWENEWLVGEQLGKGGQGITYRVTLKQDSAVTGALKRLKNNSSLQARGRMYREVVSLQTLSPGCNRVPRVLAHNTERYADSSEQLFVVMELVAGKTLEEMVAFGRLPIDEGLAFASDLCRTVAYAHGNGILHRDLKPANIIVRNRPNAELVIVDYGLSFNSSGEDVTEANDTIRNRFLDLPETNTPNGDLRDPRSDLTAILGNLFFCLSGQVPGQLQDGSGRLPHQRDNGRLDAYHDADFRIAALNRLLTRAFSPNIANRFQTVDELSAELAALQTASSNAMASDPREVARRVSQLMRTHDRPTQLGELKKVVAPAAAAIQQSIQSFHGKLEHFTLQPLQMSMGVGGMGGMGGFFGQVSPNDALPEGLDLVEGQMPAAMLQVQHHPLHIRRQYVVAARGLQCVLLAKSQEHHHAGFNKGQPKRSEWKQIVTFESFGEHERELTQSEFESWLNSTMFDVLARAMNPPEVTPNPGPARRIVRG